MKKTKDKKNLLDLHLDMLHLHSSTRERKKNHELIYRNIFSVCGKPKKILDFGCGLNAFSLPFIGFRDFNYTCCDSVEKDVLLINDYLKSFGKKFGFKGDSFFVNVFSEDYLKKICKKKYDVCFLFKMTDVMDYGSKKHNNTEKFLRNINSNFVVLSFPTKTVSGKRMNRPRRKWFEMMVKRIGYSLDYFEVNNECFYIVSK
jgi:hypothetical protein